MVNIKRVLILLTCLIFVIGYFFDKNEIDLQYLVNYFSANAPSFSESVIEPITTAFATPNLSGNILDVVSNFFNWIVAIIKAPIDLITFLIDYVILFVNLLF